MAINPAIAALLAAKMNAQVAPAPAPPAQFPSTIPGAVGGLLAPLAQQQQADQANLVEEQQQAASGAMQALLSRLAAGPNPAARAAQVGPSYPVSAPAADPTAPGDVRGSY